MKLLNSLYIYTAQSRLANNRQAYAPTWGHKSAMLGGKAVDPLYQITPLDNPAGAETITPFYERQEKLYLSNLARPLALKIYNQCGYIVVYMARTGYYHYFKARDIIFIDAAEEADVSTPSSFDDAVTLCISLEVDYIQTYMFRQWFRNDVSPTSQLSVPPNKEPAIGEYSLPLYCKAGVDTPTLSTAHIWRTSIDTIIRASEAQTSGDYSSLNSLWASIAQQGASLPTPKTPPLKPKYAPLRPTRGELIPQPSPVTTPRRLFVVVALLSVQFTTGGDSTTLWAEFPAPQLTDTNLTTDEGKLQFSTMTEWAKGFGVAGSITITTSSGGQKKGKYVAQRAYLVPYYCTQLTPTATKQEAITYTYSLSQSSDISITPDGGNPRRGYSVNPLFSNIAGITYTSRGNRPLCAPKHVELVNREGLSALSGTFGTISAQTALFYQFAPGLQVGANITRALPFCTIESPRGLLKASDAGVTSKELVSVDISYSGTAYTITLNAAGQSIEIQEDFRLPLLSTTDTDKLETQARNQSLSRLSRGVGLLGSTASFAGSIATGNVVGAIASGANIVSQGASMAQSDSSVMENVRATLVNDREGEPAYGIYLFFWRNSAATVTAYYSLSNYPSGYLYPERTQIGYDFDCDIAPLEQFTIKDFLENMSETQGVIKCEFVFKNLPADTAKELNYVHKQGVGYEYFNPEFTLETD